jgi:hypothetical protein
LPVRTTRLMLLAAIVVASFRSILGSPASLDTATAASVAGGLIWCAVVAKKSQTAGIS